jgi:hypothetical protein
MNVYLEDFREIVTRLKSDNEKLDKYRCDLRSVDPSLEEVISENLYTNTYYFQTQLVLDLFLGKELRDWIDWFLYEMPEFDAMNDRPNVTIDGIDYHVTDIESFMLMAENGLKLPKKPKTD